MNLSRKLIRVMLVDDHQTMLWGLAKLIEDERLMQVVGTATNCDEAVIKINQLCPDVVLLDLDLGGKSALDILPALHTDSEAQVLIFTGERDQAKLDLAISRGARGILRKDASADQVIKAIEKIADGEIWLDHEAIGRVLSKAMSHREHPKPDPEHEKQKSLTLRERKIIHAISQSSGANNKELSRQLFISDHTLKNHLTSIYQKLDVSNRLELYIYTTRHQIGAPVASANTQA